MKPRVAILQLPGVNGEDEAAVAVRSVGLEAVIVPWKVAPECLRDYQAYILPGGFSYQDRVRAGAVAARLPLVQCIAERAASGAPVLGLCNGAQILIESGLVPGDGGVSLALAPNRMPGRSGYLARWVWCEIAESNCLFTQAYAPGERVPLPVAHAEGRFLSAEPWSWERRRLSGQVPLGYAPPPGEEKAVSFPWNPNGAEANAAGVCNDRGNVLALMPHPERAQALVQVPLDHPGAWGDRRRQSRDGRSLHRAAGPGRGIFLSLAWALGVETAASSVSAREVDVAEASS